jgi:hypothetical protein
LSAEDLPLLLSATTSKETFCPSLRLVIPAHGIGSALQSLHSDVLREPLPERIAELLRQLDTQLRQLEEDADKA